MAVMDQHGRTRHHGRGGGNGGRGRSQTGRGGGGSAGRAGATSSQDTSRNRDLARNGGGGGSGARAGGSGRKEGGGAGSAGSAGGGGRGGGGGGGNKNRPSFHLVIKERFASEEPVASQRDAHAFVDLLCRHREPEELAKLFTDPIYNGAERLRDLLGPNTQISVNPSSVRDTSPVFSYQTVIIPLLRLLTSDAIRKSLMGTWTNPMFSILHNMDGLELRLVKLFHEMTTSFPTSIKPKSRRSSSTSSSDAIGQGLDAFLPSNWIEIALPLCQLMKEVAARIKDAASKPDFQEAFDMLVQSIEIWEGRGGGSSGMEILGPTLRAIEVRVEAIRSSLALGDESTREEEKEKLRRKAFLQSNKGSTLNGPGSARWDGPGELSLEGTPRHDNDAIRIEDIDIDPTAEELTCQKLPYLPRNNGGQLTRRSGGEAEGLEEMAYRHLETQFRLLRHEMVGPLQEGLNTVLHGGGGKGKGGGEGHKKSSHILRGPNTMSYIFHEARVEDCAGDDVAGVYFRVSFNLPAALTRLRRAERRDFWERKRILMIDSLVLVIGRSRRTGDLRIVTATIANRDPVALAHDRPTIGLACSIGSGSEQSFRQMLAWMPRHQSKGTTDSSIEPLMIIQTQSNYIGVAPILRSLQSMAASGAGIPMARHLIMSSSSSTLPGADDEEERVDADHLPAYLRTQRYLDLQCLATDSQKHHSALSRVDLHNTKAFPVAALARASTLESSQIDAIKSMLTQPVALIQGPPGTGKTYIGVKVVELLVKNFAMETEVIVQAARGGRGGGQMIRRRVRKPSNLLPIVCVCYTNHALDQFLESLLDAGIEDIVRVGGGSKSERLQELNLRNVRPDVAPPLLQAKYDARDQLKSYGQDLERWRQTLFSPLLPMEALEDFLYMHNAWMIYESIVHPPPDEDGFVRANLQKKSSQELWKMWLEEEDMGKEEEGDLPQRGEKKEKERMGSRRKGRRRRQKERDDDDDDAPESYFAHLALDDDDDHDEEKQDDDGESGGGGKSPPPPPPPPSSPFVALGQHMMSEGGAASSTSEEETKNSPLVGLIQRLMIGSSSTSSSTAAAGGGGGGEPAAITAATPTAIRRPPSPPPPPARSAKDILHNTSNAWTLPPHERRILYQWIEPRIRAHAREEMERVAEKFREAHRTSKAIRERINLEALRTATIIGLTTTGASKYQHLLNQLGVKIIVVEEAAEVLEAHVLACLSDSIEQIILIGDHLQLRPKVETYELTASSGKGYNLDISLFERLAMGSSSNTADSRGGGQISSQTMDLITRSKRSSHSNTTRSVSGFPIVQLKEQRRMRPEIADLIRLEVYPDLKDDSSLREYPAVSGMRSNLFFMTHEEMEDAVNKESGMMDDGVSKSNKFEVQMVVGLTSYLLKQGYPGKEITVLTPYLKQLHDLRNALSKVVVTYSDERDELALAAFEEEEEEEEEGGGDSAAQGALPLRQATAFQRVRTATIDNFQGEESTIIIISLVRSNPQGRIGFLKMANRVNVLLSRARHGMYLIGNPTTLIANPQENIWPAVINCLDSRGQLGPAFPLMCTNHPDRVIDISKPEQFETFAQNGGCTLPCDERMPCGHVCPLICHPKYNRDHVDVPCAEPCLRLCPHAGHACPKTCGEACGACRIMVPPPASLPCGHRPQKVLCHLSDKLDKIICREIVTIKSPTCSHQFQVPCSKSKAARDSCPQVCNQLLTCGHRCLALCGKCEHGKKRKSESMTITSAMAPTLPCTQTCGSALSCGHTCALPCHAGQSSSSSPCRCDQPCPQVCRHSRCGKSCNEVCIPCAMECDWACEHQGACQMPCAAPCDRAPCDEPCAKLLDCGHPCPSICGEVCPSSSYCHECASADVKARTVDLLMMTSYGEHNPREEPVIVLQCGHIYTLSTLDGLVGLDTYYQEGGAAAAAAGGDEAAAASAAAPSSLVPAPLSVEFSTVPTCPECRHPITYLKRYGRPVKKALVDNTQIKYRKISRHQLGYCKAILKEIEAAATQETSKGLSSSKKQEARLKEARKILDALGKHRPPTTAVFEASAAIAQRIGLPMDDLRACIMQRPDDAIQIEALIYLCSADVLSLESHIQSAIDKARKNRHHHPPLPQGRAADAAAGGVGGGVAAPVAPLLTEAERIQQVYDDPFHQQMIKQAASRLRKLGVRADATRNYRLQARASYELVCLIVKLGRRIGTQEEKKKMIDEAIDLCQSIENNTLNSVRNELGPLAKRIRLMLDETITDAEIKSVLQAMARTGGYYDVSNHASHWFTCPNGHPYYIGECGGAVVESQCPECGARVGGHDHTLTRGNRQATDFVQRGLR